MSAEAAGIEENSYTCESLYESSYPRLRRIAASLLNRERLGHTLQATALVGELFLKLRGFDKTVSSVDHFYRIAARAMRQVLVDHGRHRSALKNIRPEGIAELLADRAESNAALCLDVQALFQKLRSLNDTVASTVWLRCVEGMTLAELAALQKRPVWRVRADYDYGLEWLASKINR